MAVFGRHQIRLDKIRAKLDGQGITFQRMIRKVSGRAPVTNHQRFDKPGGAILPRAGT